MIFNGFKIHWILIYFLFLSLSLVKNEILYLLYSFKIVKIRDSNQFKERIRIFFH